MSILIVLAALCIAPYAAAQSYPGVSGDVFRQEGIASWYGPEFDGRPTALGEIFDSTQFTAAHPTLPFGTFVVVTNKNNNRQVTVRVNDRGPFVASRIIDLSKAAAEHLDMIASGTAPVLIETIPMQNSRTPVAETPPTQPYPPPSSAYTPYTPPPPPPAYTPPAPTYTPAPPAYSQPYPPPTAYTQEYPTAPAYYVPPPPAYYIPEMPVYVLPPVEQAPPPPPVMAAPVAPSPPPPPAVAPLPPPPVEAAPVVPYAPITVTVYPPPSQPVQNIYQAPQSSVSDLPPLVSGIKFIPSTINPLPGKSYRLQVGAYEKPRNAVDAFSKLKEAGLDPSYDQYGEKYRVVLKGVRGSEMQSVSGKLERAGFREVWIIPEE